MIYERAWLTSYIWSDERFIEQGWEKTLEAAQAAGTIALARKAQIDAVSIETSIQND